jgi:hypothetical protein
MLYGNLPDVKLADDSTVKGVTVRVPNPPKAAVLRLPTSDEMLTRLDGQKSIRKSLGRRKSQTDFIPNPKADMDLFNKIRLDKGEEFNEFEAAAAIWKLTYCEVIDCEETDAEYRVTLKTPFGETVHTLSKPSEKDLFTYRRSVLSSVDLPHGLEELKYRTEPAIALYGSVAKKIEGYADGIDLAGVPPHHKSAVIVELAQSSAEIDLALDPNS